MWEVLVLLAAGLVGCAVALLLSDRKDNNY